MGEESGAGLLAGDVYRRAELIEVLRDPDDCGGSCCRHILADGCYGRVSRGYGLRLIR
jgi:hypothetical protein